MNIFGNRVDKLRVEVEQLYEEMRTLDALGELAESKGWAQLKGFLDQKIGYYDSKLAKLCTNPKKHEDEIRAKNSMKQAFVGLLGCVERTLAERQRIQHELSIRKPILEEIAEEAGLNLETAGN